MFVGQSMFMCVGVYDFARTSEAVLILILEL